MFLMPASGEKRACSPRRINAICILSALVVISIPADAIAQEWNPFRRQPDFGARRQPTEVEQPMASEQAFVSADNVEATRRAAEAYRRISEGGGWPTVPKGPLLRSGENDYRVVTLRQRLAAEGYRISSNGSYFDAGLQAAVKQFQLLHGLRASGIVNGETLASLNVSARARAAELDQSNRVLADLLQKVGERPYVVVNIPSFELQVVTNGRTALYSRVIVGKTTTQTPVLNSHIRAVDFLPYWHVPTSIAQRAIIPAIQKDPSYLARERIRVFSAWGGAEIDPATVNWFAPQATRYVFRQDPGPHNALGLVRIDMPNKFTVYMHDTPLKRLFHGNHRAQSAGCVRVQNIFALAGLLIGETEEAVKRRLEPMLMSGEKSTTKLNEPVPVHFTYLTAWVAGDGPAQFRNDLYDRDEVPREKVAIRETDPWRSRIFELSP